MIIAIDDKEAITELVRHVAKTHPQCQIVARAVDRTHVYDLYAAGCRDIICKTFDGSVRMGRSALEALGNTREDAQALADQYVADDREFLIELAALYKPDVPVHENTEFVARIKELVAERDARVGGIPEPDDEEVVDDIATGQVVEG